MPVADDPSFKDPRVRMRVHRLVSRLEANPEEELTTADIVNIEDCSDKVAWRTAKRAAQWVEGVEWVHVPGEGPEKRLRFAGGEEGA